MFASKEIVSTILCFISFGYVMAQTPEFPVVLISNPVFEIVFPVQSPSVETFLDAGLILGDRQFSDREINVDVCGNMRVVIKFDRAFMLPYAIGEDRGISLGV